MPSSNNSKPVTPLDFGQKLIKLKKSKLLKDSPISLVIAVDGPHFSGKSYYVNRLADWISNLALADTDYRAETVAFAYKALPAEATWEEFITFHTTWLEKCFSKAKTTSEKEDVAVVVCEGWFGTMGSTLMSRATNSLTFEVAKWLIKFPVSVGCLAGVALSVPNKDLLNRVNTDLDSSTLEEMNNKFHKDYAGYMDNQAMFDETGVSLANKEYNFLLVDNRDSDSSQLDAKVESIIGYVDGFVDRMLKASDAYENDEKSGETAFSAALEEAKKSPFFANLTETIN